MNVHQGNALSDPRDRSTVSGSSERASGVERFAETWKSIVLTETPRLLAELFRRLEEMRKDLSDEAAETGRSVSQAQAITTVCGLRGEIEVRFLAELSRGFETRAGGVRRVFAEARGPESAEKGAEGGRERQEALVLGNLVSKAENRYSNQLKALRAHTRDAGGLGGGDPIGPQSLCSAFRSALEPLPGFDPSAKLVVYKLFDKQVMDGLGDLYAKCLACSPLQNGSPEDGAAVPPGRRAPAAGEASGSLAADAEGDEASPAAIVAASRQTPPRPVELAELRGLLAKHRPRLTMGRVAPPMPTGDLVKTIARLEREIGQGASHRSQARLLRMRLRNELRPHDGGQVRSLLPEDDETLELVFMLFDSLFLVNSLDEPVKALIGRLQVPIAKLALFDKAFFSEPGHPARRFINGLVRSALGWVDDRDRGPGSLVRRIELVVSHALAGNGLDARYFEELDGLLSGLVADERAQARDAQERSCQEMREREERSTAEALVRRMIEGRLATEPGTPEAVARFLFDGWARVMVAAYREGGAFGEPWLRADALLDQLVWSVQPKREDDDRRELLRRIPELLRGLREGMSRVSFDQRRLASVFRELKALHMAALRQADGGSGPEARRSAPAESSEDKRRPKRPAAPAAAGGDRGSPQSHVTDERFAAGRLTAGTWLEINRAGGRKRVKLAWYGPGSGVHLFVDRRGLKALELTGEELGELLGQGVATIVGQTDPSPMDRAFADLVAMLEQS